ncbi:M1 family aminopeptidase [Jidongwangia harbinensis]|uniref:M1 family aminopeptidase n=1 Tax=Jidongwangia harbinensis TaxID=2878561 RepID=UPI001CD9667C|nr:M1 family aminopeptidase [Jidongwangia harbinensis]MCA2213197.1 immune inhibitor A [Jidongwangia harbinensis]
MLCRAALASSVVLAVALASAPAAAVAAEPGGPPGPGAPGVGDPYFPLDGNGGYDVRHYGLDLRYTPATDVLAATATIRARATQHLSAFNLDFQGLTIRSITVDGRPATWSRSGGELTVTPRATLRDGQTFLTRVTYDGVPELIEDPNLGSSGVFHTDDGMVIVGQPDVAATWFPVNDHPIDKAAYTIRVTVPKGLEAVANGVLTDRSTRAGWTTWTWDAREPMASYLATATVGEFDLRSYRAGGIRYWDAIDPDLFEPVAAPRTGSRMAISQSGDSAYKRLTRTIDVPAGGATLDFWTDRDTEADWDFFFVEARTAGADDWTTLPDANGHTSPDIEGACASARGLHPFLTHYLTDTGENCTASGTTGTWAAASGASDGYEQWSVDLARYAGKRVEVSLTYLTDEIIAQPGVVVDDVTVSTGAGSTSFEADGDTLDGWATGGAPDGSPENPNTWISGTRADLPATEGDIAAGSLARQPEIIRFLSGVFGPYPFSSAGGIVDDTNQFGFALENQTRPIYARGFFSSPESGDSVVVHELAHQWYGDSLALQRWQDIWLNEAFATYASWLWGEHDGLGTAQEAFNSSYQSIPADSEFWQLRIGDPGPEHLFDGPVYERGAMTMHALRKTVGDRAFFRILRTWATSRSGDNVTTPQFVALAERISGQQLDDFFTAWLYTPAKPPAPPGTGAAPAAARQAGPALPAAKPAVKR